MADSRYSPFLYDGIDFSNPAWRLGDRSCRRIHHSAPELHRLFRETEFRVMDQENSVHLLVDIPGIKGKDLLVRIDGGVLRIEGSRMLTSGESTKKFKFSKNFLIDDSLDVTNLKAVLEKGVLTIEVQKKGRPVLAEVSDNPIDDKPDSTEEESSRKTLKRASNLCPTIFFAS